MVEITIDDRNISLFFLSFAATPLPRVMSWNRLITFPSKDASLLINGKDLWKLDCTESGCQWIELPQKLKVERWGRPVAMFLDRSFGL